MWKILTMNFKIISHRGCMTGPDKENENKPKQILNVISKGYDVEVDLWSHGGELFLGHDSPTYPIDISFLKNNMWVHCKNLEAAERMLNTGLNWFWHDLDKMTLTSQGFIWCFPDVYLSGGISVDLEKPHKINKNILGICTDYPIEWESFIRSKNEIFN
jgi:hypothetical protein